MYDLKNGIIHYNKNPMSQSEVVARLNTYLDNIKKTQDFMLEENLKLTNSFMSLGEFETIYDEALSEINKLEL